MDESTRQIETSGPVDVDEGPAPRSARTVVLGALIAVAIAVIVVSAATLL